MSAVLEIFPNGIAFNATSDASCFTLCQEVSLGFPLSRRLLFVGDDSSSFVSWFANFADPSLMSMILMRNSAGTVS